MAAENFSKALARVLVYEGGYSNNPKDPGGATNKGITQQTFGFYLKSHGEPARSVQAITDAEVAAIYRSMFWDVIKGDQLRAGVDFAVFDAAVNSGPGQAGKWLQQALGPDYTGKIDGLIGRGTVAAANAAKDDDMLVSGICARRMAMLRNLKTWSTFGKGWAARVSNVVKIGQAWAAGSVGPLPVSVSGSGGNAKANAEDLKKPPVSINAATVVATVGTAGTTVSGVASAFDPLKDALGQYLPWVAGTCATVAAGGLTLTAIANQLQKLNLKAKEGEAEIPDLDLTADALFDPVSIPEEKIPIVAPADPAPATPVTTGAA